MKKDGGSLKLERQEEMMKKREDKKEVVTYGMWPLQVSSVQLF